MKEAAQLVNKQERTFDRGDSEVQSITKLITDDGQEVLFTASMKQVYNHLYTFQTNESRPNYPDPIYPNMDQLAQKLGTTKPTIIKAINTLEKCGVLIKDSIHIRGPVTSNSYVVLLPQEVVERGIIPGAQPKPTKQKPTLSIVHNEEKSDEQRANESGSRPADIQAVPEPVQTPDQSAGDVLPDPVPECASSLVSVPLTLNENENEIEIASLQNQHSEVEEKIRKFDMWLKGKDVEKMIRFAGDYGLTRESPQAIRDLVTEKRDNAVRLKNRLEIELESHGIFDHIAEGVY